MEQEQFDKNFKEIKDKVSLIYHALVGNEITKDGGLIRRIDKVEARQDKQEDRMDKFDSALVKMKIYERLLWLAGGAFVAALINYIF